MLMKKIVIALIGLACAVGIARSETPHGCPTGISAAAPTGLTMRSERTELTYLRDSARVVYQSRAVLWNPGFQRQVELRIDFADAQGYYDYADGSLAYGKPYGAPTFAVRVDDRPVAAHCDTIGDSFRFHWSLAAPKHGSLAVQAEATFPWTADACAAPDHRIEWRPADDAVFDVAGAIREMVFRFVPTVSFMAVDSWTDGAAFERGSVTWRWRGHGLQAFDLLFDPEYADEHTELFSDRYRLLTDKGLDNSYFEIFSRSCEESDLDPDEGTDSLSTPARAWVEDARSRCRAVISSLSKLHALARLDTTSSGTLPPLAQPDLSDAALSALNAVERRNLRYAVGLMWALDPTKNASAILARVNQVTPGR